MKKRTGFTLTRKQLLEVLEEDRRKTQKEEKLKIYQKMQDEAEMMPTPKQLLGSFGIAMVIIAIILLIINK